MPEAVRDHAGKDLHDERDGFRRAFRDTDRCGRGSESHRHEERKNRMDHFRRNIHKERDESEGPDRAGDLGAVCFGREL